MPFTKTIVVLAKSIKHGGHCVAGKDVNTGKWVRVVSDTNGAELSNQQCKCTNTQWQMNGNQPYNPKILQKLKINFSQVAPLINQPENHVVSENIVWQQEYRIDLSDLKNYLDNPISLWDEGSSINYHEIESGNILISQSLYLVQVTNLKLYSYIDNYNKTKRRASFSYNEYDYDFPVTDPNFDSILSNSSQLLNILCISLGEQYTDGVCYKIIATIF